MVKEDSILAQKIVGLTESNIKDTQFHDSSVIYVKSNERIQNYNKYLENRKKVLSVIASSDQIINMILGGTQNIDCFDISVFPKYYMYLKLAGIMSLDFMDYIDFFYQISKDSEEYDDLYFYHIRDYLNKEGKEFWDSIMNFYDWNQITESTLFSKEFVSVTDTVIQNKYLSEESFNNLRNKIPNVNINTYQGNIIDIASEFKNSYDLIYLSNIIYYVDRQKYKEMLENLKLNDHGIILTYLYDSLEQVNNYFNEDNYYIEEIPDSKAGLLIKTK